MKGNEEHWEQQRRKRPHRCGVCWQHCGTHDNWQSHCESAHGAVLAEFGFHLCHWDCPGVEHVRLKHEGLVPRKVRRAPGCWTAPDGTIYEQQELPA